MDDTDVRRPQRWFWGLTLTAIAAMGALYRLLHSTPGPVIGLLTLLTALVLAAATIQAARILTKLAIPGSTSSSPRSDGWRYRSAPSPEPQNASTSSPRRNPATPGKVSECPSDLPP